MIDPSILINALVALLQDIPDLVTEVNGDPERIYAYDDQYPKRSSLPFAIHQMPAPSIMAAGRARFPARSAATTSGSTRSPFTCAHAKRSTATRRRPTTVCSG
jgi:hypothetical protein